MPISAEKDYSISDARTLGYPCWGELNPYLTPWPKAIPFGLSTKQWKTNPYMESSCIKITHTTPPTWVHVETGEDWIKSVVSLIVFISVGFWVLTLHYSYTRYCPWGKLREGSQNSMHYFCNFLWVCNCFRIKGKKSKRKTIKCLEDHIQYV